MSSAANHRKRSHRSEAMHRQGTTKHRIYSINKMNKKVSFFDRVVQFAKKLALRFMKKESDSDEGDN